MHSVRPPLPQQRIQALAAQLHECRLVYNLALCQVRACEQV